MIDLPNANYYKSSISISSKVRQVKISRIFPQNIAYMRSRDVKIEVTVDHFGFEIPRKHTSPNKVRVMKPANLFEPGRIRNGSQVAWIRLYLLQITTNLEAALAGRDLKSEIQKKILFLIRIYSMDRTVI